MARSSSPTGEQIVALVDEIQVDARIAAKAMPASECAAWLQAGSAPLMARAAWADATEMAKEAQALGQHVDPEQVFRKAMGQRALDILLRAVGAKR